MNMESGTELQAHARDSAVALLSLKLMHSRVYDFIETGRMRIWNWEYLDYFLSTSTVE